MRGKLGSVTRFLMMASCSLVLCLSSGAVTLHVSKLGDDSDGASWSTAYKSLQKALEAVPDASGGHRILVRPDTYMEAMLSPAFTGAAGAYNELLGDIDGSFGSGTTGQVILDSGDPELGFKSYDWWGPIRSNQQGWSEKHTDPTFSAIIWDRWILRNLYVTGADAGLFWDLTDQTKPFTVIVEDSVGIGRAFGGGVGNCLSRPDEPITFRRCHLWALDWWGDTAGAYVRVENPTMPERPDVVFEDCTMVSPQCALKGGNFGFHTYMRVKLDRCRLVALNFSQPQGTPIDGAIQSVEKGEYLSVDLCDTTIMGYKVFGVRVNKDTVEDLRYTTHGDVKAYVQFEQTVPAGIHRLGHWPADTFANILPPPALKPASRLEVETSPLNNLCESAPVVWENKLCLFECVRPASGGDPKDYYLKISDMESKQELTRFAESYGLACAIVQDGVFYAFASRFDPPTGTWNDVTLFKSRDLQTWESKVVIEQEKEHLFNSSVCKSADGFTMAYESDDPSYPAFTIKFAQTADLENWTKIPKAIFGKDRYTACPCLRYAGGWFYALYLEHRSPRWCFETYLARSKDLENWELSPQNPILTAGKDEGINASDPDLIEYQGKTFLCYSVGDQRTWSKGRWGTFAGGVADFFGGYFEDK